MTDTKKPHEDSRQKDEQQAADLKAFIQKKKLQNKALKKIIDQINSTKPEKS